MRVPLAGRAVSGPTGVADAHVSANRFRRQQCLQIAQLAHVSTDRDVAFFNDR